MGSNWNKRVLWLPALFFLLAAVTAGSLFFGSVPLSGAAVTGVLSDVLSGRQPADGNLQNLIWEIRLPRILCAAFTGAVLGVVGLLMQTVARNPLAEPYVLGVSSGAGAGASGAIVFGWLSFLGGGKTFVCAFLGSFLAIALVLLWQGNSVSPVRLVLTGMGVSAFFQAVTTLIVYSSHNEAQARSAMFWLVGSFSGAGWPEVRRAAGALTLLFVFVAVTARPLDLLLLGQRAAAQTGLNVRLLQLAVVMVSSAAVAVVVSQAGVVGFAGLIVPHMMRRLLGVRHRLLAAGSALFGAAFLAAADTVARTAFAPREVPVGIMTAFAGAPVFLLMVKRSGNGT